MLERRHHLLLSRAQWLRRVSRFSLAAGLLVGGALAIGVVGYHEIGGLRWIDALLEASMILGGMGAVAKMDTDAIKLFASFYALTSGLIIVTSTGIFVTPFLHRLLHHFHAEATMDDATAHRAAKREPRI